MVVLFQLVIQHLVGNKMRRPSSERLILQISILEFKFHAYIIRTAACCFSRIVFTIKDILYSELQCRFFGYFIIYGRISQEVRIF